MGDKRWLSIMIGVFGCFCLARAALCAYFFKRFLADGITPYLTNDVILIVKNTQELMLVSILVFAFVALLSIVSAIGIFLNRVWASKVWLCATVLIFAYILFAFYNNPSGWLEYLAVFVLCLCSWFILWHLPRKQPAVIS